MKKQLTTLLTCRSTTTLGVSKPCSPCSYRSNIWLTALSAVPCVVKSVAAHHAMNATNTQKMASTCGGAILSPPYLRILNPVPLIIETVNAGTTINPSNSGTLSNQNCNTVGFCDLATSLSMHCK